MPNRHRFVLTSARTSAAAELNGGLVRRRGGTGTIARAANGAANRAAIARVITHARPGIRFGRSDGIDVREALEVSRQLGLAQLTDVMERLTLTRTVADHESAPVRDLKRLGQPLARGLCRVGVDADITLGEQSTGGETQRPTPADLPVPIRARRNKYGQRLPGFLAGLNRLAVIRHPGWGCGDRYFPKKRDSAQSD